MAAVTVVALQPVAPAVAADAGNARVELVSVEPAAPAAGEEVTFTWRVSDPDPFAVMVEFDLHYGDGPHTRPPGGVSLPCSEVVHAAGLEHTFKTFHRYRSPGAHEGRVTITTQQMVCGAPLGQRETSPTVAFVVQVH
ncbi:MAG TPA: hypothetical protein VM840_08205 [Actinomycetota bacterium]|nr:hypothetical protein [Actinomycetota bacterium]